MSEHRILSLRSYRRPFHERTFSKNKFESNLEALRGFAAFSVVLTHCFGYSKVLNGSTMHGVWTYSFPGHLAVLIFFILSGYVIGLTTKKSLTWQTTGLYLKKRFLRLYPIYVLGIVLALLFTHNHYSPGTIISNLIFLQRVTADPLQEIGVIWSLNYEVLFYFLFILISIYDIKSANIFFISLAFAFFFQLVVPVELLAMYGFGFCFWVTGLWLSQTKLNSEVKTPRYTLFGLLFILLSFSELNLAHDIMHYKLGLDTMRGTKLTFSYTAIMFSDFSYLPLGILVISYFINKKLRYNSLLVLFILAVPVFDFLFLIYYSRTHTTDYDSKIFAYAFYIIGTLLLFIGKTQPHQENNLLPKFMINLGSISYGIYLIHFIIIILIGRVALFYGNEFTFWTRIITVIVVTLLSGYFLEKIWQPFAVRQLKKIKFFQ